MARCDAPVSEDAGCSAGLAGWSVRTRSESWPDPVRLVHFWIVGKRIVASLPCIPQLVARFWFSGLKLGP